jgi:hypothetical protein
MVFRIIEACYPQACIFAFREFVVEIGRVSAIAWDTEIFISAMLALA